MIGSLFLSNSVIGQEWIETQKVELSSSPISFSVDTEDNIYLGFENGSLVKFSSDGEELSRFSLPNQSSLTLVEAQNNRKVFFFQKDIQQITILDRFSTQPKQYGLSDFGIDFGSSVCPSPDGLIWVAENNPPRLKKIDMLRKIVVHEVQHNLGDSILFMKTIQNLLFIVDENGLQILDQYGNLLSSINCSISYIQYSKNEIIATHSEGFVRIDPYGSKVIGDIRLSAREIKSVIKLTNKYAVVRSNTLSFYTLTQSQKE